MNTIYALSSGSLPAGIAVIRISGPLCRDILMDLTGIIPSPRSAVLRTIRDRNQQSVDEGLILFFPGPNSFTGGDCAELHVHGSKAVVAKILFLLSDYPNARHAEPGEFTRLALQAGKMDLVEVEGLSDLLSAETEMQRRLAIELSQGHLSELYLSWMQQLTQARAMIEAELDFADEEDIPGSVSDQVWPHLQALEEEILRHLALAKVGEIVRDGLKVVLVGAPNSGKSSLLNALTKRDVAIVTPIAGTTRDALSVDLDIDGYAVTVTDTAGLRDTDDIVEMEGIKRAHRAAEAADLVLYLHPCNEAWEEPQVQARKCLLVGTKSDLATERLEHPYDVVISTLTGDGMDRLLAALVADIKIIESRNSFAIPTRERHVSLLKEAVHYMSLARDKTLADLSLRAEYLRLASHRLGSITGFVDTEALLDVIFSRFCVGK